MVCKIDMAMPSSGEENIKSIIENEINTDRKKETPNISQSRGL